MVRHVDLGIVTSIKNLFGTTFETLHPSVPTATMNYMYYPIDHVFRAAKDKYGDKFMPLCSVYRSKPPVWDGDKWNMGRADTERTIRTDADTGDVLMELDVRMEYQIDLFSDDQDIINAFDVSYLWWLKNPYLPITFAPLAKEPSGTEPEVENQERQARVYLEEPADNTGLGDIFDAGRFFRHTYVFEIEVPLFMRTDGVPRVLGLVFDADIPSVYEPETSQANYINVDIGGI